MKSIQLFLKPNAFGMLFAFLGFLMLSTPACAPGFDAISAKKVVELSTAIPALMDKATNPFKDHEQEANTVLKQLDEAQAHAASIKNNKEIGEAWKVLKTDIVAPFIEKWKKGPLSKTVIEETKKIAAKSLEAIKNAENAKKKKKGTM